MISALSRSAAASPILSLSGKKRTFDQVNLISHFDPNATSGARLCCNAPCRSLSAVKRRFSFQEGLLRLGPGIVSRWSSGTRGTSARTNSFPIQDDHRLSSGRGLMSSKKQPQSLHGNETEQKSGLSRHYREIGIKAVAAATRKESTASPRTGDFDGVNRKKNSTEGRKNKYGRRTQ